MRRLVTAEEMRAIDRCTIQELGVPGLLLMENAGLGVLRVVEQLLAQCNGKRVTILCGGGNNGGDGMVVARHLFNRGIPMNVYLVGKKASVKGDARVNMQILESFGINIPEIYEKKDLRRIAPSDIIVDALLGTGITGEVRGLMAHVVDWVNRSSLPVVSVDLPSGLHCDDGSYQGTCVRADQTVTMAELKRGLVLPPGRELAGQVTVVDISAPAFVSESAGIKTFLVEQEDIRRRLPQRPPAAHKGDFGKILVLAGSSGMTGAATLASLAALRVGGGLTILCIPRSLNAILEEKLTEVMTKPLPETPQGTLSLDAEAEIDALLEWADVLAIGPGLSTVPETGELIRRIVKKTTIPMVIDADGLNAISGREDILEKKKTPRIITPHYGELSRLNGLSIDDIAKNRIEVARESASRFGGTVVLKGAPTVIGHSDGYVYVNSTGNSGMATPGTGDVLTGMVVGFLAQGCSTLDASLCGVYLHGLAGDTGAQAVGQRSLIAGDLIDFLSGALLDTQEGE